MNKIQIKITTIKGNGNPNITINTSNKGNHTVTGRINSVQGYTVFSRRARCPVDCGHLFYGVQASVVLTPAQANQVLEAAAEHLDSLPEGDNNPFVGLVFNINFLGKPTDSGNVIISVAEFVKAEAGEEIITEEDLEDLTGEAAAIAAQRSAESLEVSRQARAMAAAAVEVVPQKRARKPMGV